MSNTPADLKYSKSHEWIKDNGDGTVTIGITDHAQELLGDLVYVELPEAGDSFGVGDDIAVVESVKAASDVYCPVAGEVVESNESLADSPENVNDSPYEDGWLFKIKLDNSDDFDALMDADAYTAHAEAEDH